MTETNSIDIIKIMAMIPHRYPFLLLDKVRDVKEGESAVGIKNVTINEPFFPGHFPQKPVMPGVLIIEAMAQTCAVLVIETMGIDSRGKLVYFMSIDDARFRKPVGPGDVLELHVKKVHNRRNVWKFACEGMVDGNLVAEAVVTAMISDE